jgi:hypothetical protein
MDMATAVTDPRTVGRYRAKIVRDPETGCWIWTGAISGHGHGRFWLGDGNVVIAHRFAWALAHPAEPLPENVAHQCDSSVCQNPAHLTASSFAQNRREWAVRRHTLGSPLRDRRGARGRAEALRTAARNGASLTPAVIAGLPVLDRDQPPLW